MLFWSVIQHDQKLRHLNFTDEQRLSGLPALGDLLMSYRASVKSLVFCVLCCFPLHVTDWVLLSRSKQVSAVDTILPCSRNGIVTWQAELPRLTSSVCFRKLGLISAGGRSNEACTKNNTIAAKFCLVGGFPRMIQCNESSLWALISTLFLFFSALRALGAWFLEPSWEVQSLFTMNMKQTHLIPHRPFFLLLPLFKSKIIPASEEQSRL